MPAQCQFGTHSSPGGNTDFDSDFELSPFRERLSIHSCFIYISINLPLHLLCLLCQLGSFSFAEESFHVSRYMGVANPVSVLVAHSQMCHKSILCFSEKIHPGGRQNSIAKPIGNQYKCGWVILHWPSHRAINIYLKMISLRKIVICFFT